jgi:PilZ domain
MDAVRVLLTTQVVIGVLGRDHTVRLLEISRAGCLLESSRPVAVGTVGSLVVRVEGTEYVDRLRVARCEEVAGAGGRHRLGAQFLSLYLPGDKSLRRYVAELAAAAQGTLSFRPEPGSD